MLLVQLLKGLLLCRTPRGLPGQDATAVAAAELRRGSKSTTLSLQAQVQPQSPLLEMFAQATLHIACRSAPKAASCHNSWSWWW